VVGALGAVAKSLQKNLKKAGSNVTVELFQKAALLGTSQILRRVLDSDMGKGIGKGRVLDIPLLTGVKLTTRSALQSRSGVLTGNDTRWHSTISGCPLPERTDFGPAICS